MVYICTKVYYLAIRKRVMTFATTWMDLVDIMLCEISQKKTNTAQFHIYVESKKTKLSETETRMVVARCSRWGNVGQKVQTSSC